MTNKEFSNEFDVLYNNITSNQAPGLDEYEKSVFLTKAQDEIIKAYFNPKTNKVQEGFDENEKRQIDFSMIMRSVVYDIIEYIPFVEEEEATNPVVLKTLTEVKKALVKGEGEYPELSTNYVIDETFLRVITGKVAPGKPSVYKVVPFIDSFFDMRDNTKSITLEDNILMLINEYVEVTRGDSSTRLEILPINYREYSRLMSKPFKRPIKNQAWRLLDNSDGNKKAEIIIGPIDTLTKYVIRYIKRPRAIILDVLSDDTSLDGYIGADKDGNPVTDINKAVQGVTCELDPILHPEILQRAVELAKAAYMGDLTSQVALGQSSQTNMGVITQSR